MLGRPKVATRHLLLVFGEVVSDELAVTELLSYIVLVGKGEES